MKFANTILFLLVPAFVSCSTINNTGSVTQSSQSSQTKRYNTYEQYIETYHPIAVEQMERYRIPASITLAQGLLESGAGNSTLAKKSNNHFGIKADKNWKGRKTTSPDNGRNCYFRVYDNVRESYEDHSQFLVTRERYAFLFELEKDDYKGWAKGLKKAGYAEDPNYPSKLIDIIERYELYKYDKYSSRSNTASTNRNISSNQAIWVTGSGMRQMFIANGLPYIIGNTGDTFKSLAKETGVSRRKLIKYNDLYKDYNIKAGDIIYLEKKNSKADKKYKFHTTGNGESLYSISQKYGIRLKKLLNMNPQFKEYAKLKVGDIIRLR